MPANVAGIRIPTEINDHGNLLSIERQLLGLVGEGMAAAAKTVKVLLEQLAEIALGLEQVKQMPDRVGPNIGKPTAGTITTQAEIAARANARLLEAMASAESIGTALAPLEDAIVDVQTQATEAVGDAA